jgi:hypothetical protein
MTAVPRTIEDLVDMAPDDVEKWAAKRKRELIPSLRKITCDKCLQHFLPPYYRSEKLYVYSIPETSQEWSFNVGRAERVIERDGNGKRHIVVEDLKKLEKTLDVDINHVYHLPFEAAMKPIILARTPEPVPGFGEFDFSIDGSHRIIWHIIHEIPIVCYVLSKEQSRESLWTDVDTTNGIVNLMKLGLGRRYR